MRNVKSGGLLIAALIASLALVPQERPISPDRGPQSAAEHSELAKAIRKLHPEATKWTLSDRDARTLGADRDVTARLPYHERVGRARSYHSFDCTRLEGQLAWKCHPTSGKTLVDVTAPANYEATPDTCSASVRGIEVTPRGMPRDAIADLVDFLAYSAAGRAAIANSDCGTPTPACVVSSIRASMRNHFTVSVDIGPYEWLQMGLRRDCVDGTCRVRLLTCARWTS